MNKTTPKAKPRVKLQAERIIERFGGVPQLHRAMLVVDKKRHISVIYRWLMPKEKGGTGGHIPSSAVHCVRKAARMAGILLTAEDWAP